MADRTIKVITPATSFDFLTLDEAKTLLGITVSTPAEDAQLAMMISNASAVIARICNRIFAYEEVEESWRDLASRRVFLSHWPVDQADIQDVTVNGSELDDTGWDLEPQSGKLSNYNGWLGEPIVVTYSGGYILPDDAPLPLKQAAIVLIREEKLLTRQAEVAGIRQISHKDSRVSFFDPNELLLRGAVGGMTQAQQQISNLLYHYIRIEV
jgi:hypothetical protein